MELEVIGYLIGFIFNLLLLIPVLIMFFRIYKKVSKVLDFDLASFSDKDKEADV